MDRVVLIRLAQLNAITFAAYALPWLATRRRWLSALDDEETKLVDFLFDLQIGLASALNVLLFGAVVFSMVLVPDWIGRGTVAAGGFLGWLTFLVTLAGIDWLLRTRGRRVPAVVLACALWGISCLTAFGTAAVSGWLALHVLTVAVTVSAGVLVAAAFATPDGPTDWFRSVFALDKRWATRARQLAVSTGTVAVFLSLRTLWDSDATRWWSIGPLLALTAMAVALNWQTLRRRYLYIAGFLLNTSVTLWWAFMIGNHRNFGSFLLTNAFVASFAGILWLALELRARRLRGEPHLVWLSFHNVVAMGSSGMLLLIVFVSLNDPRAYSLLLESPGLTWITFASIVALMAACVWDARAKYPVAGLYLLGVVGIIIALHLLDLRSEMSTWSFTVLFGLYTLGATLVWKQREPLIAYAARFGMPHRSPPETTTLKWLSAFTIIAIAIVATLAYWIDLSFVEFSLRATAALALAIQFFSLNVFAEGSKAEQWRRGALFVALAGLVLLGWSWLTPGVDATWLNRSVILMLEAFGLTALYALYLTKIREKLPDWTSAARACVPFVLGAGVLALFFCLGTEIFYQVSFGTVRIHPFSLVAIGVTLAAAVVICVLFALSPAHDPLGLSERGRMRYVYVGEMMLALFFVHVRLTMPWLFTGFLERYWPLVVMVIAYFGVVTSESLRKRRLLVLAQPLERTGAFLPLLPVLGFWFVLSEVDYSLVLFVVGGLYGLLSILRRSFMFGVLAAVAGNGGLWYILHRTGDYQFLQHPQLWLIPVALSVLLAAYLNEKNLNEDQMAGIRYLSLVTIYASSTADIFINGVANSPWLPLILGSFSLAGVFAGIMFRIRGLLLLGSVFLLLSIITMIWYASANFGWTWLWYVAGIVTGATIIFMFAVFEKKRSEVMRVVEGLKEWER
jgi:hypothetical protein